jgi:vacuolar-type H+-ATPase subunit E/Vma4
MEKTLGMLASVDDHVKSLGTNGSLFVELPASYSSNLAQIKNQFEQTSDNLGGLRAVVSNVLQLIQQAKVVNKADLREKVHSIIRHVSDRLGNFINSMAEQNEHETGLFEALESLFADAVNRSQKLVASLTAQSKDADKKVQLLKSATNGVDDLARSARVVVTQLGEECRRNVEMASRMDVRALRFLSVVGNLRDVVTERFGSLSSFFIEKSKKFTQSLDTYQTD